MASAKTKEKSQKRILNFFNKIVATNDVSKPSIGQISSDVIPASPLSYPKREKSAASFAGRKNTLNGANSVKEYFTKLDKKKDLTVCTDAMQCNATDKIKQRPKNGVGGSMSLNRPKGKNHSKVGNRKKHGLGNAHKTVAHEEDIVIPNAAITVEDRYCGKEAKNVMNPLNDKSDIYYCDEAKLGEDTITNESASKKFSIHVQGIKRVANYGLSGLSPVKKKHAMSAGVMKKSEKFNNQIEIIDSTECTIKLCLKHGKVHSVEGAIGECDVFKDKTVEQAQLDTVVDSKTADSSRTSKNALEVPKLRRSLKVSKEIAKKHRALSKVSGIAKRAKELPSQSSVAVRNFNDDEDELSIIRDYVKDSGSLERNQANDSYSAIRCCGILQDPLTNPIDHSDMKNAEEDNDGITKTFLETRITSDAKACASTKGGENKYIGEAIFNGGKDSFTNVISELDFSLIEEKHDLPYCDGISSETTLKQFEPNDSLDGIEFGDEMSTTGLESKCTDNRQNQKIDFTVKPQVVIEVQTKERSDFYKVNEKILKLFDEDTFQSTKCILREDWEGVNVHPGDLAYVTGNSLGTESSITLDNNSSRFLILFPHTLISGTTISTGITCQRRAVLSELFKTDGPNEVMLLGTVMHEVFDFVIKEKVFEKREAETKLRELLSQCSYLNLLYSLDIDSSNFMEKARDMLVSLCSWAKKYLENKPHSTTERADIALGSEPDAESDVRLSVASIADIEENIICPSLGLKGKVDASVNVKIHRSANRVLGDLKSVQEFGFPLPLELKTGRMFSKLGSVEHRAQVILYTLMMSEKYDNDIEAGLLYYMRTGHLQGVEASRKEKRSLILSRNQIARFLSFGNQRSHMSVPGLLRNDRVCRRCPVAPSCMVFHKAVEGGGKETSGIGDLFEEVTGHLKADEIHYFAKWFHLIMLEVRAETASSGRSRIWTKTSKEKEDERKCFKDMCIRTEVKKDEDLWIYTFQKNNNISDMPLTEIRILKGDRVMISEENCKTFGLCFGYIESVTATELHIWCNERIRPRANIIGANYFRIEKDESLSSYKIPLANLMKLVLSQSNEDKRLRGLVISLVAPRFDLSLSNDIIDRLSGQDEENDDTKSSSEDGQQLLVDNSQLAKVNSVYKDLNPDQKIAVSRCLAAKDYLMILGMPGTGKTTTIACIISILVTLGKSVLVTSYTHTAVDNILIKVKQMKLDFVRLGQQHKVREEIKPFVVENATCHIRTVRELEQFYKRTNIVATTCLGINHPILTKKRFDYCIVDEASQITQPVCLGAIRCANTFILVGDHYQLPPLVQSVQARNSGMDISMFKLLSETHPSAIVSLRHQYRMNEDIMTLANELIYGHRMQCAGNSPRFLNLPRFAAFQEQSKGSTLDSFITRVIAPAQPVIFINSDAIPCPESTTGSHIHNEYEAKLVAVISQALIECGAEPEDIGIISPLRQQLKTIEYSLRKTCCGNLLSRIEMNTVDKYQGRDKSCIIVSFVRSNNSGSVGELLKDWRRINVAITRSKHKLVIIGSKETLSFSLILNELLNLVESKCWIIPAEKSWLAHFEKREQFDFVEQTSFV